MRIREAQKHSDPADSDPEHWYIYITLLWQNSINQGFSYYFYLMMEESEAGAGSVLENNGSGSATLLYGV
jgi:hypothetical protein